MNAAMFQVVIPIFSVILVGLLFGRKNRYAAGAEKLINEYILYVALPALLFLAVARANPSDLAQWGFVTASLSGIATAYVAGMLWAKSRGTPTPQSSLIGMAACYGTTGYMGIPILIAAFGQHAAVPAAIATIVHNIPAIVTVVVTHDLAEANKSKLIASIARALLTTLKNPLVLAVLAGGIFSLLRVPLPEIAISFTQFLGAAAGPTALFALGLGLANMMISSKELQERASYVAPTVLFKIFLQPLVTFLVLALLFGLRVDVWYATALVMAAQPIGAGAYVFASKYNSFREEVSIAIVVSLLITTLTLSLILQMLSNQMIP